MKTLLFSIVAAAPLLAAIAGHAQSVYEPYSITTVAGLAQNSGSIDETGGLARFNQPLGVAVDSNGNVYVADALNHTIRKITPAGVVTRLAGVPGSASFADGTAPGRTLLNRPTGIAVDAEGVLYVADCNNHLIRRIAGGMSTTLAGSPGAAGSADGSGSSARFRNPFGIAVNASGTLLYVTDQNNHTIRMITTAGGVVTTVAGVAGSAGSADDPADSFAARFNTPRGIAVDGDGNLYVADTGNFTVRKIFSGGGVATLAGLAGATGSQDGPGNIARFSGLNAGSPFGGPCGVAVDASGNVLVTDQGNHTVRKIAQNGVPINNVTTLAGAAGSPGAANGVGLQAQFRFPAGVAADLFGNIHVADALNHTIRFGANDRCGQIFPGREMLIANGAVWKYWDHGHDPGAAWREANYDDSLWLSGPAELGFGDSSDTPPRPEATVINGGPPQARFITTYFRKEFYVADPFYFTNLVLQLMRDDGAAVYLNGVEALRDNLPSSAILFNTPASGPAPDDGASFIGRNVDPALLAPGINVLAVEVHQDSLNSPDLSFDLTLMAQGEPLGGSVLFANSASSVVTNKLTGALAQMSDGLSQALYYAPDGETNEANFYQINSVTENPWINPGVFYGGRVEVPATTPAGQPAMFQVRVWERQYGDTYEEAAQAGPIGGRRALLGRSGIVRASACSSGSIVPSLASLLQPWSVETAPCTELVCADIFVQCRDGQCQDGHGIEVPFQAPYANYCGDTNVTVVCTPPSGSEFPLGTNVVRCVATDSFGRQTECSFNVVVTKAPPVISDFNPKTGGLGAVITIQGSGFGIDPNDVSVVLNDGNGSLIGLRVLEATGDQIVAEVLPFASTAHGAAHALMIERGVGGPVQAAEMALDGSLVLLSDAWRWRNRDMGGASAAAFTPVHAPAPAPSVFSGAPSGGQLAATIVQPWSQSDILEIHGRIRTQNGRMADFIVPDAAVVVAGTRQQQAQRISELVAEVFTSLPGPITINCAVGVDAFGNPQILLSVPGDSIVAGQFNITKKASAGSATASITPVNISAYGGTAFPQNAGQHVSFAAAVNGTSAMPTSHVWVVEGPVAKDYRELTRDAAFAAAPMEPADLRNPEIAFYWKPLPSQVFNPNQPNNGAALPRRVSVVALLEDGTIASGSTLVPVERNQTDPDRQPIDFYTFNHAIADEGAVLRERRAWAATHWVTNVNYSGSLYFDFHRKLLERWDAWRVEFGYGPDAEWDPATALPGPTDFEARHLNRNPNGYGNGSVPFSPKPEWFKLGSSNSTPRPSNGLPTDTSPGQMKLEDFPPTAAGRDLLGTAIASPWDSQARLRVGGLTALNAPLGDMSDTARAARDPIFWRYQRFVNAIATAFAAIPGQAPRVVWQHPARWQPFLVEFPAELLVEFDRPVQGIAAGDLKVNGSPATAVSDQGGGVWAFSGFAAPALGPVAVLIGPGMIRDLANIPFGGAAWSHILLSPAADSDSDLLMNEKEIAAGTSPIQADSDNDGIVDGLEVTEETEPLPSFFYAPPGELPPLPPVILAQPQGLSVAQGSSATLNAQVAGDAPLRFQWEFKPAGGAAFSLIQDCMACQDSPLLVGSAQAANAGEYRLIVSNPNGSATSSVAVVVVAGPPVITMDPEDHIASLGASHTFFVAATGSGPLTYQWHHNSTPLAGATNSTLHFNNVYSDNAGSYHVVVSNSGGSVASLPADLSLSLPLAAAASMDGAGVLSVIGSHLDDDIEISLKAGDPNTLIVRNQLSGADLSFAAGSITKLFVEFGNGTNKLVLNDVNGSVSALAPLEIHAGTNDNRIICNTQDIDLSQLDSVVAAVQGANIIGALAQDIINLGEGTMMLSATNFIGTVYSNLVMRAEELLATGTNQITGGGNVLMLQASAQLLNLATNFLDLAINKFVVDCNPILDPAPFTNSLIPLVDQADSLLTLAHPEHRWPWPLFPITYHVDPALEGQLDGLENQMEDLISGFEARGEAFEAFVETDIVAAGDQFYASVEQNLEMPADTFADVTAANFENGAAGFEALVRTQILDEAEGNIQAMGDLKVMLAQELEMMAEVMSNQAKSMTAIIDAFTGDVDASSMMMMMHHLHDSGGCNPQTINTISVGGNNLIIGTSKNDRIDASSSDKLHFIFALAGDDDVTGGEGADFAFGGPGNDKIQGGEGFDVLGGGGGNDCVYGGKGVDILFGDGVLTLQGEDHLEGGEGVDIMFGFGGNDRMLGGMGLDVMLGMDGNDNMHGGDGDGSLLEDILENLGGGETEEGDGIDIMFGGCDDDKMRGGSGKKYDIGQCELHIGNLMIGGSENDEMEGGDGIDFMFGSAGDDVMKGGSGIDAMWGNWGADEMHGQKGGILFVLTIEGIRFAVRFGNLMFGDRDNDDMHGGPEQDVMFGNAGEDEMNGGDYSPGIPSGECNAINTPHDIDLMFGGPGNDTMDGAYAPDLLFGGAGNDTVKGDDGRISALLGTTSTDLLFGGDGDDLMEGGVNPDIMFGGEGNDRMLGYGSGNSPIGDMFDVMFGGQGDDFMDGERLPDLMFGGPGDDDMQGDDGEFKLIPLSHDLMFGGPDDDYMRGGRGIDIIFGNRGDDHIETGNGVFNLAFGNQDDDWIIGGPGSDILFGAGGRDLMEGHGFIDLMFGNGDGDVMDGGAWPDVMFGNGSGDCMWGSFGPDVMFGNHGDDIMYGEEGPDLMFGGDDADDIHGDEGPDLLFGNKGEDRIHGGTWPDIIFGGVNDDIIRAGDGPDLVFGNSGADIILGEDGVDIVFGNAQNDTIYGGSDFDLLFGNTDEDTIFGGLWKDIIFGNASNDKLDGGEEKDRLFGGRGSDTIYGKSGDDRLFGGKENDSLYGDDGEDVIRGGKGDDNLHDPQDKKFRGGPGDDTEDTQSSGVFADIAGAEIHGLKWLDANGNGQRDADEPGMPGVTIIAEPGGRTTVTDGTGRYSFTGLPAGTYTVREVVPQGYIQTFPSGSGIHATPSLGIVDIASLGILDCCAVEGLNFGNFPCSATNALSIIAAAPVCGSNTVCVTFNQALGEGPQCSVGPKNFSILPLGSITAATVSADRQTVCLTLSQPLLPGLAYTVIATGVLCNPCGVPSPVNSQFSFSCPAGGCISIQCPPNMVVSSQGPGGARVPFVVTATNSCSPRVAVTSSPASGSLFPLGTTTVTSVATDLLGNSAACSFTVTVLDTTPPVLACPQSIVTGCTSPDGAIVNFSASAADNNGGSVAITFTPPSGSQFPIGDTEVFVNAADASANSSCCSFIVSVTNKVPQLSARVVGQFVQIDLPDTCAPFTLESSASLGADGKWSPVSFDQRDRSAVVPMLGERQFFRLRGPKPAGPANLIENGDFASGANRWTAAYGDPSISNEGFAQLCGTKTAGAAIQQTFSSTGRILQGRRYLLSMSARFVPPSRAGAEYVKIRALAFSRELPESGAHPSPGPNAAIFGVTGPITSREWTTIRMPIWTASKNFDGIALNAESSASNILACVEIDNITLTPVAGLNPCNPFDAAPLDEKGQVILPSFSGTRALNSLDSPSFSFSVSEPVYEDVDMFVGRVADLYPGQYDGTATWYPLNDPSWSIGGFIPTNIVGNLDSALIESGVENTPSEVVDVLSLTASNTLASITGPPAYETLGAIPSHNPVSNFVKDPSSPFEGRDIIFVHGFRTGPLLARMQPSHLNHERSKTKWPEDSDEFYDFGYWKTGANKYWSDHIRQFLRGPGYTNRYLVVAHPVTQTFDYGIHAVLSQISEAMRTGRGVQFDEGDSRKTNNFGQGNYVIISHSAGALMSDLILTLANRTKSDANLASKLGNLGYIADGCKAHIAMQGAISGSHQATLALAAADSCSVGFLWDVYTRLDGVKFNELPEEIPDFWTRYPQIDARTIARSSQLRDMCPLVAQQYWGSLVNQVPVPVLTVPSGHASAIGIDDSRPFPNALTLAVKNLLHAGFDDGVVTIDSAVGNSNSVVNWPSGFSPIPSLGNQNLIDRGVSTERWLEFHMDQVIDPRTFGGPSRAASGAVPFLSPSGMVQPVASFPAKGAPNSPLNRYNNHYSFLQTASDHFWGPNGVPFPSVNNIANYQPTKHVSDRDVIESMDDDTANEESSVITDTSVYQNYGADGTPLVSPVVQTLPEEYVRGQTVTFTVTWNVMSQTFSQTYTWWVWKRTYHLLKDYETMTQCDYIYRYALRPD